MGDFLENDVSYDYTDQKLRYMERFFYNSSKPVTEVFEQIFDYNEVFFGKHRTNACVGSTLAVVNKST